MDDYKDNNIDFDKIQKALELQIQQQEEEEEVPDGMLRVAMDELPEIQDWQEQSEESEPDDPGEEIPDEPYEPVEQIPDNQDAPVEEIPDEPDVPAHQTREVLEKQESRGRKEAEEPERQNQEKSEARRSNREEPEEWQEEAGKTAAATIITEGMGESQQGQKTGSKPRRKDRNVWRGSKKISRNQKSTEDRAKKTVSSLMDYKERIWAYRKKKWIRLAAMAAGVLVVLLIVANVVKYWTYDSYSVVSEAGGEDTISASYANINGNVLKYSLDSAQLSNSSGKLLWNSSYSMNAPTAVSNGDTCIIYDTQGTAIHIYQKDGEIGKITTKLPIVKACVASQGVVAAVLESGDTTSIEYYEKDGTIIASSRTTLDNPGYPLDISLSQDGLLMGVTYLYVGDGKPSTKVIFYNFSSTGQNQTDNVVNSFDISGHVTPDIEYLNTDTCLVIRDDGFTVYKGKQIPKEDASVTISQEILSVVHNDDYVVFVTKDPASKKTYEMTAYNMNGREVFRESFDFPYSNISLEENHILMYNRQEMCVYSLSGVCKYQGTIDVGILNQVLALGGTRYMVVTETGTSTLKLK
ncbi:MAG: DUF5711 family protein [Lachnospiraceae bacterium]|nr:DUF5711 family protein [Lachnospiraceae bacterium]